MSLRVNVCGITLPATATAPSPAATFGIFGAWAPRAMGDGVVAGTAAGIVVALARMRGATVVCEPGAIDAIDACPTGTVVTGA